MIGGIDALQPAVAAGVHQAAEVRQPLVAEEQLGGGAVEADDEDLHGSSELPSMAGPSGHAQGAQDRGGEVHQPRPSPRNGRFMNRTPGTSAGSMMWSPLHFFDVVLEVARRARPPSTSPTRRDSPRRSGRAGRATRRRTGREYSSSRGRHSRTATSPRSGSRQAASGPRRSPPSGPRPRRRGTIPWPSRPCEVQVDPAQARAHRPSSAPSRRRGGGRRPPRPARAPARSASRPWSCSQVFRWTPRRKLPKPWSLRTMTSVSSSAYSSAWPTTASPRR